MTSEVSYQQSLFVRLGLLTMRTHGRPLFVVIMIWTCVLGMTWRSNASSKQCQFEPITDRIYVIHGAQQDTCPKASGHPLTNPAAILTDEGIVLVDPGSTPAVTGLVLDRLAGITTKPVVAVFNSHIHGLYWLGNDVVRKRFPDVKIYGHERMIERIKDGEGAYWVDILSRQPGSDGLQAVAPDYPLVGGETLQIGGVAFKIHHTGHAHTDHDIMVEVVEDKALFLGGIVVEPEVPSQGVPADAKFKGQMAAINYALKLPVQHFVPGRGKTGGRELPERGLGFLQALYSGVERYYEDGLVDFEIAKRLKEELKSYQRWYDFKELGRVVSHIYLQVEEEKF